MTHTPRFFKLDHFGDPILTLPDGFCYFRNIQHGDPELFMIPAFVSETYVREATLVAYGITLNPAIPIAFSDGDDHFILFHNVILGSGFIDILTKRDYLNRPVKIAYAPLKNLKCMY